jgi:hypothetical protein
MAGTKHCLSIPKTRWLYATDSLRWIQAHMPDIQSLITVYRNGNDLDIRRARRNPVLNILAEDHDDDEFQAMEDCLFLFQRLRFLCHRFEQRNATLSQVVPAVRETLKTYQNLYSARVLRPHRYEIRKHILSRFIARMAMSFEDLCITVYVLSLEGRNEIRAREIGFTIADVPSREDQYEERRDSARPPDSFDIDHGLLDRDQSAIPGESSSDEEPAEEALETNFDPIKEATEELRSYQRLQTELFEIGDVEQMFEYPLYSDLMSKAIGVSSRWHRNLTCLLLIWQTESNSDIIEIMDSLSFFLHNANSTSRIQDAT